MRIRITQRLPAPEYEGYDVRHLVVGQTYDMTSRLATLLVVGGYAMPEMRLLDRAADRAPGKKDESG